MIKNILESFEAVHTHTHTHTYNLLNKFKIVNNNREIAIDLNLERNF